MFESKPGELYWNFQLTSEFNHGPETVFMQAYSFFHWSAASEELYCHMESTCWHGKLEKMQLGKITRIKNLDGENVWCGQSDEPEFKPFTVVTDTSECGNLPFTDCSQCVGNGGSVPNWEYFAYSVLCSETMCNLNIELIRSLEPINGSILSWWNNLGSIRSNLASLNM